MKQVITFSDLHFIFFLELTQRILMAVLHEHGLAMVCSSYSWGSQQACLVCVCHFLSSNIISSIQPLEFPKYAWSWWAVLLCHDENELDLGQYYSVWFSFEQHLLALDLLLPTNVQMWFGLLTNGELAPFLTPSLWLRRFYELLLLTSSLWPQGVLMSCSENFCEWNRVEEGVFIGLGIHCGADTYLHAFGD
jgi:hypothetical protein